MSQTQFSEQQVAASMLHAPVALERILTGIPQLDSILHGGIPRYSLVFVAGLPGTGKSILAQQIAFANARAGNTCLYLSTFAEPAIKLLRYLQGFTFFDPALFGQRIMYGDLGSAMQTDGPAGVLRQLDDLLRAHRPSIVVIDSFKALRDRIAEPLAFRQFTLDLAIRLTAWEATALLVGEYAETDLREEAEFAIADGIIYLYGTEEAERQKRFLRVLKLRGTPLFGGEHFFDIDQTGISVYPRMTPQVAGEYALPVARTGSLVAGLNSMLGGGIYAGSTALIAGASGTGKSLIALSFLVERARQGEPGLLVSFEESPNQIIRNVEPFGWDLGDLIARGLVEIFHVSPSELNIDRHAFHIQSRAEQIGARMVVVDSITAFEAAVPSMSKYQSYLWAITDYCKRTGITCLLTTELADSVHPLQVSRRQVSFITDSIILLRYLEANGEIKRTVAVLKMRGSDHEKTVRELQIAPAQITVGARIGPVQPLAADRIVNEIEG